MMIITDIYKIHTPTNIDCVKASEAVRHTPMNRILSIFFLCENLWRKVFPHFTFPLRMWN